MNQATATSRPRAATAGPLTGQPAIFHPSAATVREAVHRPPARRTAAMSRISAPERSRKTAIGPSAVSAAEVWQQSQTRASSRSEAAARSPRRAVRSVIEPASPRISRPSSQKARTPRGCGSSETNPCSPGPRSWRGPMRRQGAPRASARASSMP
ncbi:MAG TPA: hypothetical protein VIA45_06770 [Thermoanaerobaculia bacterium]